MWGCCPSPSVSWGASGRKASLLHQPYKYCRTPRWVDHRAEECCNDATCCSLGFSYHSTSVSQLYMPSLLHANSDCKSTAPSQILQRLSRRTIVLCCSALCCAVLFRAVPTAESSYQASRNAAASNAVRLPRGAGTARCWLFCSGSGMPATSRRSGFDQRADHPHGWDWSRSSLQWSGTHNVSIK